MLYNIAEPALKNIHKFISISLDGSVRETPYAKSMEIDYQQLSSREFLEKWCQTIFEKNFQEVFKPGDFNGQDNKQGLLSAELIYVLTMHDGSALYASFDLSSGKGPMLEMKNGDEITSEAAALIGSILRTQVAKG